jgi:hypothetical protein
MLAIVQGCLPVCVTVRTRWVIVWPSSAGLLAKNLFRVPVLQAALPDFKLAQEIVLKMSGAPEG